jgi:hypothetical protein
VGAAQSGAVPPGFTPSDPDLARLFHVWPRLPDSIKTAIMVLAVKADHKPTA